MKKIKIIFEIDKDKKKGATASVAGIGALSPQTVPDSPPAKKSKKIKVTIKKMSK